MYFVPIIYKVPCRLLVWPCVTVDDIRQVIICHQEEEWGSNTSLCYGIGRKFEGWAQLTNQAQVSGSSPRSCDFPNPMPGSQRSKQAERFVTMTPVIMLSTWVVTFRFFILLHNLSFWVDKILCFWSVTIVVFKCCHILSFRFFSHNLSSWVWSQYFFS